MLPPKTVVARQLMTRYSNQRSGKSMLLIVVSMLIVGAVVAFSVPAIREPLMSAIRPSEASLSSRYILRMAEKGPFRIMITENGTVDSLRNATLTSKIEGSTTIISLVPEGSRVSGPVIADFDGVVEFVDVDSDSHKTLRVVADDGTEQSYDVTLGEFTEVLVEDRQKIRKGDYLAGDVLCELDSSVLVEKEKEQQIKLTTAKANLEKAQKNIQIQETTNASNIAKAELAESLAELDLEKYLAEGGEYQQALETLKGEIKQNEEALAMNMEDYERVRDQARRGYANLNVLEGSRIKVTQSEIQLVVKKGELNVLEKFTYTRTVKELKQLAEDTKRETQRAKLEGEAAMALLQADLEAAKLTEAVETEKLELLRRQIAASRLVASQAGEVVYASQKSSRSEPVVIEEGASVRERQAIINLPDLDAMKIDARIHESKISRVMVGQPVEIEIDALPGDPYHGRLQTVSSVPMPGSWPNTDLKEYQAVIEITDSTEKVRRLKPGMTAQVRIIVEDRKEDVLQVPVQSVISFSGHYFSYVAGKTTAERREIKVGDANDEYMEVLDGISEGEMVIMSPRTHFSKELSELENRLSTEAEANRPKAETPDRSKRGAGGPSMPGAAGMPGEMGSGRPRGEKGGEGARSGGPSPGAPQGASGAPGGGGGFDPKAIFDRQDKNKDGAITKDEASRPETFDQTDGNGDGKITLDEMMEAFRKRQEASGQGR
ncbi:MAG: HlyD family efflux transporter periplasmic adaptor subunit [Planctomycetaceae bacterium]